MKKIALLLLPLAAFAATGCATKKYVGKEIATVNSRVDGVQTDVEEAQTQIKKHGETLTRHDQEIQKTSATAQTASKTAQEALDRATAAGKLAQGKLLYEVTLTDDKVHFASDRAELGDEAKAALSGLADQLKTENQGVYIEIQGHTDGVGGEDYNYKLGEERAEAVRRFLNTAGIPLHKMSVISYGEASPIADNKTREGRAQNRRVVLVVLQ